MLEASTSLQTQHGEAESVPSTISRILNHSAQSVQSPFCCLGDVLGPRRKRTETFWTEWTFHPSKVRRGEDHFVKRPRN
jgi:hypothetical protein